MILQFQCSMTGLTVTGGLREGVHFPSLVQKGCKFGYQFKYFGEIGSLESPEAQTIWVPPYHKIFIIFRTNAHYNIPDSWCLHPNPCPGKGRHPPTKPPGSIPDLNTGAVHQTTVYHELPTITLST